MFTRKYLAWFNLFFCLFMSAVFSICMPLGSGAPTVPIMGPNGFLVMFLIGFFVSMLVSNILPLGKWGAGLAMKYGAKPGSTALNLLSAINIGFMMLLVMAFTMIAYNTGFGITPDNPAGLTLFDRFINGLIQFTPLVLLVVFFLYPICTALAEAIVKPQDRFIKAPPADGAPAPEAGDGIH